MGRKPLSDAMKKARGTLQPCRARGDESIATVSNVPAPSWLPTKAKKIFLEKAQMLSCLGVLTALDIDQLALYANARYEVEEAIKIINKEGRFNNVYDDVGRVIGTVPNPFIKHMNDQIKVLLQIGSNFGFSPASRSSITKEIIQEEQKDDFSDFEEI